MEREREREREGGREKENRTSAIAMPEGASALLRFSDVAAADTDEALALGTCLGFRVGVISKDVALGTNIQRSRKSATRVRSEG
jgi:hypothetical protein